MPNLEVFPPPPLASLSSTPGGISAFTGETQARCRWEAQLVWGVWGPCLPVQLSWVPRLWAASAWDQFPDTLRGATASLQLLWVTDSASPRSQLSDQTCRKGWNVLRLASVEFGSDSAALAFLRLLLGKADNQNLAPWSFIIKTMHFLKICCRSAHVPWFQTVPSACKTFSGQWEVYCYILWTTADVNQSADSFEVVAQSTETV